MQCPNCKTPCVGCAGAKIVKASNGATVCTRCIGAYELKIKTVQPIKTQPTNVNVSYTPPQKS